MSTQVPAQYLYTKDHEWIQKEDNLATIGITDFAQSSLGDIVFLELPEVGDTLGAGAACGVVESIKSVSDIYAPVSGKVIAVNNELLDAPEQCNEKPYDSWLVKIEMDTPAQADELMSSSDYSEFIQQSH